MYSYQFGDKLTRLNQLLFMDDLKLFARPHDQIDSLVNIVYTFSDDTGMAFEIKNAGFYYFNEENLIKLNREI